MIWFGGLLLTIFGFVFGRVFAQSEAILTEKRRVYEEFLRACPNPNEAYGHSPVEEIESFSKRIESLKGALLLYAAPAVVLALGRYMAELDKAALQLSADSPPLHSAFKSAARAQNDLIIEMRRDALAWSAFAFTGPSRLPKDALEQARKASLD